MFKIITIFALLTNFAFAEVKVSVGHDEHFFTADVVEMTSETETNQLAKFYDKLDMYEEYRETENVKIFNSEDKNFSLFCQKTSHNQIPMITSCSFKMKRSVTTNFAIMATKEFAVWNFTGTMLKEIAPLMPQENPPILFAIERKFHVIMFDNHLAFSFNI